YRTGGRRSGLVGGNARGVHDARRHLGPTRPDPVPRPRRGPRDRGVGRHLDRGPARPCAAVRAEGTAVLPARAGDFADGAPVRSPQRPGSARGTGRRGDGGPCVMTCTDWTNAPAGGSWHT